jgi:hypothetical protein
MAGMFGYGSANHQNKHCRRVLVCFTLILITPHIKETYSFPYSLSNFYSAPTFWGPLNGLRAINTKEALPSEEHINIKKAIRLPRAAQNGTGCGSFMTPQCRHYIKVISFISGTLYFLESC